eukprot:943610-Pelagomonas_calceolata.AAC.5
MSAWFKTPPFRPSSPAARLPPLAGGAAPLGLSWAALRATVAQARWALHVSAPWPGDCCTGYPSAPHSAAAQCEKRASTMCVDIEKVPVGFPSSNCSVQAACEHSVCALGRCLSALHCIAAPCKQGASPKRVYIEKMLVCISPSG